MMENNKFQAKQDFPLKIIPVWLATKPEVSKQWTIQPHDSDRKEVIPLEQNQLQQLMMENNKFQIIGEAKLSTEYYWRLACNVKKDREEKKIKMMTITGEGNTQLMDTSDE
ncbi:uncharacterized protein LOC123320458 isoform X1 [Coccinella septempunctata]|uniref:uncharacterized protein LOC123320458 isoform X1 n=1 Tax=Coccinella septempunctata TaxID=41139 RepID=UPI001D05C626|nr:uncharacterized protein LOC123320458 isoform X1 [Coccinella septempunctata]